MKKPLFPKQVPFPILYALFLIVMGASLGSCNRNNKSDAYGNFEAIEVIVSSQANGQLINLIIEEGMKINSGDTIGLIDTIDLSLKREQLISQEKVILAKLRNIDSEKLA